MNPESQAQDTTAVSDEIRLAERGAASARILQQSGWKRAGCTYIKIRRPVRYHVSDVKADERARAWCIPPGSAAVVEARHG